MRVFIPSALGSYTQGGEAEVQGATLSELLADLDRQYPGIRFRMVDEQDGLRAHIRIFVNGEQFRDLSRSLAEDDEIYIVQALSGG